MMERLRGEVTLLSSHILSEVEACCNRMIILNRGQIVAEGTLMELQKEFINKTVFEVVTHQANSTSKKRKKVDETCELLQDEPVDASGKKDLFSTDKGEVVAESILKHLMGIPKLEFLNFRLRDQIWKQFSSEQPRKLGRK